MKLTTFLVLFMSTYNEVDPATCTTDVDTLLAKVSNEVDPAT